MRKPRLARVLMIPLTILLSACSQDKQTDEQRNQTNPPAISTDGLDKPNVDYGKTIFLNECATCHGKDGKVSMAGMEKDAANLTDKEVQNKTDAELKKIIREGKKENPEMAGHPWLTEYEMESLILYLRTLK